MFSYKTLALCEDYCLQYLAKSGAFANTEILINDVIPKIEKLILCILNT